MDIYIQTIQNATEQEAKCVLFITQHCNPKYKPHIFGIIHSPEVVWSVLGPQSEIWFISHCPESEIWFISHSVSGE